MKSSLVLSMIHSYQRGEVPVLDVLYFTVRCVLMHKLIQFINLALISVHDTCSF